MGKRKSCRVTVLTMVWIKRLRLGDAFFAFLVYSFLAVYSVRRGFASRFKIWNLLFNFKDVCVARNASEYKHITLDKPCKENKSPFSYSEADVMQEGSNLKKIITEFLWMHFNLNVLNNSVPWKLLHLKDYLFVFLFLSCIWGSKNFIKS